MRSPNGHHSSVVEHDDTSFGCDPVDHPRVPVVHDRCEVVQEHHGRTGVRPEPPIRESCSPTSTVNVGEVFAWAHVVSVVNA